MTQVSDELITLELDGRGVATITLNRPARLNAINMAMRDLLWEYLQALADIPEARVIVFRGEGRAFSAGADISEFGTAPSVIASRRARHERDVWWALLKHRCVTIARMHGFCFGAGLELPLCCDLRIARRCDLRPARSHARLHPKCWRHADPSTRHPTRDRRRHDPFWRTNRGKAGGNLGPDR